MAKKKATAKRLGMEGTGRNKAEARRQAQAGLQSALEGGYTPEIVECGGCTPWDGWAYQLIATLGNLRNGRLYGTSYGDRPVAVERARYQVVQLAMDCEAVQTVADVPALVTKPEHRQELADYAEFQRRYRQAKRRGMNYQDAHAFACRDPRRAELWAAEGASSETQATCQET